MYGGGGLGGGLIRDERFPLAARLQSIYTDCVIGQIYSMTFLDLLKLIVNSKIVQKVEAILHRLESNSRGIIQTV